MSDQAELLSTNGAEFSAARAKRQQEWNAQAAITDQIVDRLGMPIDGGIKDTVTVLNLLDVRTTMSCEGHIDGRHSMAPYIHVDTRFNIPAELLEQQRQLDEQIEAAEETGASDEDVNPLYEHYHILRSEVDKIRLLEEKKIKALLADFYKGKTVDYDRLITLNGFIMQNIGAETQLIRTEEERRQKLAEYQTEFKAFTDFLKEKFLSQEDKIEESQTTE